VFLDMTLMDAKPPKPPSGIRKHISALILGIVLLAIVAGLLAFKFWDIRQEHAVSNFLNRLEQGDFQEAYRLWQPAPSYSYQDFVHDWGQQGDYGKIREFQILGSRSEGSVVIVTVQINQVSPPLDLMVDRKTLGLAFSPESP
jgi:hypothetical protein